MIDKLNIDELSFFIKISNELNQSNEEEYTYVYGKPEAIIHLQDEINKTIFHDMMSPKEILNKKIKLLSEKSDFMLSLSQTSGINNNRYMNCHIAPFSINHEVKQEIEENIQLWIEELKVLVGKDNVIVINIDKVTVDECLTQFSLPDAEIELFNILERKRMRNDLEQQLLIKQKTNQFKV